jgi:hypothetical protein
LIGISKDLSKDLTVFTATGEILANDMIEVIEKLYSTEPTRFVIWDLTEANGNYFKSEDIDRVIEVATKHSSKRDGGKTVLVASSVFAYGMSRMYQAKVEHTQTKIEYHVTNTMEEALRWLEIGD